MQSYKTGQVGGRASQVGGITCIFRVKKRIIEPVVVFSVSLFVSTRSFGAQLLCSLLTVVGATLVVK